MNDGDALKDKPSLNKFEGCLPGSKEWLRAITDSVPVLLRVAGENVSCIFFNKRWLDFTGRTFEQEVGEGWIEDVHPEDRKVIMDICKSRFNTRQNQRMEYRLRRADGVYRWFFDSGVPLYMPDGSFAGCIHSCFETDELNREEEQKSLIYLDKLTRIANRLYFDDYLNREWKRALRSARPLSLVTCGVNCFEDFYTACGQPESEECIKKIAKLLCDTVKRPGDFVARYGCGEFAVVLPETDNECAAIMANKFRAGVEAMGKSGARCRAGALVTISCGSATAIPATEPYSPAALIAGAENALRGQEVPLFAGYKRS